MLPERLGQISELCSAHALTVLGGFHPNPEDAAPEGSKSVLMIGPDTGFWDHFKSSPEYSDGQADPLDRWSSRVLTHVAAQVDAKAHFPFGGPPYTPFIAWALRTGQCHVSPIELLVHTKHGLMVSFRGALSFKDYLPIPSNAASPCENCTQKPCKTACPVNVLTSDKYDIPGCREHLRSPAGQSCKTLGCLVRRACPINGSKRDPEQSGFHMAAFQGD